jgi:cell division protein FtsB
VSSDDNSAALMAEFHARVLDYENSNERLRDEVTRLRLQIHNLSEELRRASGENDRLRHAITEGGDI